MSTRHSSSRSEHLPVIIDIPVALQAANQGRFFLGYADDLQFGNLTSAWAGLYNPPNSGVNLYVYFWSVSDISESPYRIQIWFNAVMPGTPNLSGHINPSNFALTPLPTPHCQIIYASNVTGSPQGGIKAFVRRGLPNVNNVETEGGKLIFPPGGLFALFLSNPENPEVKTSGTIYFEWWEESIQERP